VQGFGFMVASFGRYPPACLDCPSAPAATCTANSQGINAAVRRSRPEAHPRLVRARLKKCTGRVLYLCKIANGAVSLYGTRGHLRKAWSTIISSARWSPALSSRVNLHHEINFRALCGENLVTYSARNSVGSKLSYSTEWLERLLNQYHVHAILGMGGGVPKIATTTRTCHKFNEPPSQLRLPQSSRGHLSRVGGLGWGVRGMGFGARCLGGYV